MYFHLHDLYSYLSRAWYRSRHKLELKVETDDSEHSKKCSVVVGRRKKLETESKMCLRMRVRDNVQTHIPPSSPEVPIKLTSDGQQRALLTHSEVNSALEKNSRVRERLSGALGQWRL